MKYQIQDVVWISRISKAAVVEFVGDGYYDVRTYDGPTVIVTESELGRK